MPTSEGVVLIRDGALALIRPDLSAGVALLPSGTCDATTEPGGSVVAACLAPRGGLLGAGGGPGH
jgi:hypothetical protein